MEQEKDKSLVFLIPLYIYPDVDMLLDRSELSELPRPGIQTGRILFVGHEFSFAAHLILTNY